MATVTKINIDLRLRAWELAALVLSTLVLGAMSWVLLTDFSVRRILWPASGEGHLARPIGKVTSALNKTLRQGRDQPEFVDLAQDDEVYPLDTLMAGPGSALKITLSDNSVLEVGENSMVRLNFDSSLRLSGINRETVIEVVAGTVSAKGGQASPLRIKSENRTFVATQEKALELSSQGGKVATTEARKDVDLLARARESAMTAQATQALQAKKISEAREKFAKMGGVMTPNAPGAANSASLSDIFSSVDKGVRKGRKGGGAPLAAGDNSAAERAKVAMNTKAADRLMHIPSGERIKTRVEIAKATSIEPADNHSVQTRRRGAELSVPVELRWKAVPENASFTVRFSQKGQPDQVIQAKAEDGEVEIKHLLRRPGDYVWRIEDMGGSVLSVRNLHVNSKFQAIELSDPVLIGRERGSKMWAAQDKWVLLFRWQPVKGVTKYKVRIARNVASGSGVVAEMSTTDAEFVLPFKKEWQAERMFFSVEGVHSEGFQLASNNVPFMFTFLPPKPRVPINKKVISRSSLMEGVLGINWEAPADMTDFTIEIARDPGFRNKVESEKVGENSYHFYPSETGKYYWHVRGDKDNLSSPFSETWEFTLN